MITGESHAADRGGTASLAAALPEPVKPAFTVPTPLPLTVPAAAALWAPVAHGVVARAAPRVDGPSIARLDLDTPEGTSNLVSVVGETVVDGVRWLRVRLPVLPNNTTGWVPRNALGGLVPVDTELVVNLERLRAELFRHGRLIFDAPVGIGTPQAPTPRGRFYIRDKLDGFGNAFYGPVAFGTSARSAALTDWPAGGYIGIHGTNEPWSIGRAVSNGCIRVRNRVLRRLFRSTPAGTPVVIGR